MYVEKYGGKYDIPTDFVLDWINSSKVLYEPLQDLLKDIERDHQLENDADLVMDILVESSIRTDSPYHNRVWNVIVSSIDDIEKTVSRENFDKLWRIV